METIKQKKSHETPEFEVIRQNEANSKFFVASVAMGAEAASGVTPTMTQAYNVVDNAAESQGW